MRTDFRIFLVCLVGLILCVSAWNVLVDPQMAYSKPAIEQKTRKLETPLSIATFEKGYRSSIRGPFVKVPKYENLQVIFRRDS